MKYPCYLVHIELSYVIESGISSLCRASTSILSYEVSVIPRFDSPAICWKGLSDPIFLAERDFMQSQKLSLQETSIAINDKWYFPMRWPETGAYLEKFAGSIGLMVDEVHLRRFDGLLCFDAKENGGVHRCVIASITVKAPVCEVWNVLTAYEKLSEIIPNLAISKILSRYNNKIRILQEGCKGLLYMVLHARVILDLCENSEQEIGFEQVEGDFDSFQGKWIFEQLGNHHTFAEVLCGYKNAQRYFPFGGYHGGGLSIRWFNHTVIFEDLPSNLSAIRDYVENRNGLKTSEASGKNTNSRQQIASSGFEKEEDNVQSSCQQRPKVPGLQRDIEILKSELVKFIAAHGQEGLMPMRKHLRLHGRVAIEKAITRMGGFRKIATIMNLSLAYKQRKPKGYWDKLENLQDEISRFQRNWGMDPSFMPSRKSFERAGRFEISCSRL
ncbi:hypothetical protein Ahy_B08g089294 [Arachis hypogaea]|uniref:Coenzyme Q-binding protein COQ10 START domain-containing protein n=1 Tax=Arachis hypogaea TaxID=3818 RepID=A0A444XXB1_ARAHY|nr:hypothetical protein Ahy_B08g089294 [Arachis hypogaea]